MARKAKSDEDFVRRLGLMALGLVSIKAGEISEALVKEGKISEAEGKKLAAEGKELSKKLEQKLDRMSKENKAQMESAVKKFLSKNRPATAKDLKALEARIRKLEKRRK